MYLHESQRGRDGIWSRRINMIPIQGFDKRMKLSRKPTYFWAAA